MKNEKRLTLFLFLLVLALFSCKKEENPVTPPPPPPGPCDDVDCGAHGACDNGVCICDFGYDGDVCELNLIACMIACYKPDSLECGMPSDSVLITAGSSHTELHLDNFLQSSSPVILQVDSVLGSYYTYDASYWPSRIIEYRSATLHCLIHPQNFAGGTISGEAKIFCSHNSSQYPWNPKQTYTLEIIFSITGTQYSNCRSTYATVLY